jgi:hypothetical protein
LKINNPVLHFANIALKNSEHDYNKLKKLQISHAIADLSPLEGKQIRVDLQTKINQLALTNQK